MQTDIKNELDKSPERVKRMFNSIAGWYDFLNHFFSLGLDIYWRRRSVKLAYSGVCVESVGKFLALDVCCGTGDMLCEFVRFGERLGLSCEFSGVDFSESMIGIASRKLPAISGRLVVGDAMELPFGDNIFCVVSCAFGLRNICDADKGLSEMIRVCQSGGVVAILEFSMPQNRLIKYPYRFYFEYILPKIGELLAWNCDDAYNYLPKSVITFDSPKEIADKMKSKGLNEIKIVPMTFGITNLIYGKKS
ncbi:MAG: ubiquinone/menaquinone biosynthesis methyltransferase [Planctomycetaceae bacterium]|jgi:demethylmenaquinone methyltransferase/2-methoxy-6-polyprenyl-1,4-benzoquinol methylase|nr:ubiquinone/menaquinone biosynthesis methyltransferase [Planctomycetaceae bacterium]